MWKLTIRSPKTQPFEYVLKPGKNTLGRKGTNDIVLPDESASRLHAEIVCQKGKITIRDLGSTNGTYVNQKRITSGQHLLPGDQVRIGHHLLMLMDEKPDRLMEKNQEEEETAPTQARPITSDFILESYEQSAVLIYEVANRLTTVLDLDGALQEIADFLLVSIGAEKCSVILIDQFEDINELGFSDSIAKQAIDQRASIIYPDPKTPIPSSKSLELLKISTALCIPILLEGEAIALVYAYKTDFNVRPFDQNDLYLAVAVSHQAALAIQRTQILEKAKVLEQWAFTDSLTGLDNRRQILQKGEIECSRTNRFHHPLTVIMLDIDEFKQINDLHGHLVGDQVLKTVASRCKDQLREIDLIGRIGGDEFLILLVETKLDEATVVADRLLRNIAAKPMRTDSNQLFVTISMGITYVHGGYAEFQDLINRADLALLEAKQKGKNNYEVLL